MENIGNYFNNLWAGLPNLVVAIILLIVAFIVAHFVRELIKKVVGNFKFGKEDGAVTTDSTSTVNLLGNLGYLLTLLLFLPGVLDNLGLTSVTAPIVGMMNNVFNYIPNLIGAAIIGALGFFIAKLVKELSTAFFHKVDLDNLPNRLGFKNANTMSPEATNTSSLKISDMLGNIIYVLILIPVIIAALNALNISVISQPAVAMLNDIFAMIPRIIAGIVIFVIGVFLAKLVADLLRSLLQGSGVSDKFAELVQDPNAVKFDIAKLISEIVRYVIIIAFLVQAFNVIQLDALTTMSANIMAYIPKVLAAALILIGAYILGSMIKKFIAENLPDAHFAGIAANAGIMVLAALAALSQLGIATDFIRPLFLFFMGALAVAAAIAFGIGGRDFAAKKLEEMDQKMKANQPKIDEARAKLAQADQERREYYKNNIDKVRSEVKNTSNQPRYDRPVAEKTTYTTPPSQVADETAKKFDDKVENLKDNNKKTFK